MRQEKKSIRQVARRYVEAETLAWKQQIDRYRAALDRIASDEAGDAATLRAIARDALAERD